MLKDVFDFFEKNINTEQPILIGLSGGPDSTCLLHLLLLWNKAPIHLVHVDHGWRSEATDERKALQKKAEVLQLPFHYTRLDPSYYKGNMEAESREERYRFFRQVAKEVNAQGILLGHHRDDLSETVFKRALEGASLTALCGIHPVRDLNGLCIMRPLLPFTKKEIASWLDERGVSYFSDPTNMQTKFLRGKLRSEIFPYLREHFGKEFEQSLCSIASEAGELKAYLDAQCAPYFEKALIGPWGTFFSELPKATCELKHIFRNLPFTLSREALQLATKLVQEHASNKQIITGEGSLFIDRARAFFINKPMEDVTGSLQVTEGDYRLGEWLITAKITNEKAEVKNYLTDAWRGELSTYLPAGEYTLSASSPKMRRHIGDATTKEYKNYLTEKKIPHLLVSKVPVVCNTNEIVEDFLTATTTSSCGPYLHITVSYKK